MDRFKLFPYSDETWYTYHWASLPFALDVRHGVSYLWVLGSGTVRGTEVWS